MENILREKHRNDLLKFQKWISMQSHLPQNIKPLLLLRYLSVCNFDHEKARELLHFNFEYREKYPQIFTFRDIQSEKLKSVTETVQIFPLGNFTKESNHVTLLRLLNEDSSKFDIVNTFKWLLMTSDVGFITTTPSANIPNGEIAIFDFKGFSWWHFMKVAGNITVIKAFLTYVQEAVPYKIIENHFLNCSPVISKMMIFIKPFIKKEVYDSIHFHTNDESIFEYIPKDILPFEYNGTVGKVDDIAAKWHKVMLKHKEYLQNDDNWKILEKC